ncbi:hypothetical protein D4S03_03725 [bacterium]|nr:MAG: hypothetical protein D4S03_03725 [bacterium]
MQSTNSLKYYFIRHGQLVRPYDDHMTMDYETLADLSTSALDPGIRENALPLFKKQTTGLDFSSVSRIYYNNSGNQSRRSLESANVIAQNLNDDFGKALIPEGLPDLHEIRFDVRKLLAKGDFEKDRMPAIRTALYKSIVGNGTSESAAELKKRIESIYQVVQNHKQHSETVLFVTHDFFMRTLEVFIKKADRIDDLTVPDLEQTFLNYYFGGFSTDSDFRVFQKWGEK